MSNNLNHQSQGKVNFKNRRQFFKYFLGSAIASVGISYFPQSGKSQEVELEQLCTSFPLNSRCQNYLPGVQATDENEQPIAANTLLANATPGSRVPVMGLSRPKLAYLVINQGPEIAEYAVSSICTHFGCTVKWDQKSNQFNCPCHGSEFDPQGRVIRGPAKRPLNLITVVVKQNQVRLVDREVILKRS